MDPAAKAAMALEREHLLPLPAEAFEVGETTFATVDGKGCVKVRTNWHLAPVTAGQKVRVTVRPALVEIWQEGRCVARQERCYERGQQILNLEHYLEALERKPGALAGSTPLAQWRKLGRWPESYDRLWTQLKERHGSQEETREMVGLLEVGCAEGYDKLAHAVEKALELGSTDASAVKLLLRTERGGGDRREVLSGIGALRRFERPLPVMNEYDRLLCSEVR